MRKCVSVGSSWVTLSKFSSSQRFRPKQGSPGSLTTRRLLWHVRAMLRKPTRAALLSAAPIACAVATWVSCSSETPPVSPRRPIPKRSAPAAAPSAPPLLPASLVARLDDNSVSPYFVRRPSGDGLLFYPA